MGSVGRVQQRDLFETNQGWGCFGQVSQLNLSIITNRECCLNLSIITNRECCANLATNLSTLTIKGPQFINSIKKEMIFESLNSHKHRYPQHANMSIPTRKRTCNLHIHLTLSRLHPHSRRVHSVQDDLSFLDRGQRAGPESSSEHKGCNCHRGDQIGDESSLLIITLENVSS